MKDTSHEIDLNKLQSLLGTDEDMYLKDTIILHNFDGASISEAFKEPCRINGYMALFCSAGEFTAEINLAPVRVSQMSLVVIVPGTLFRVTGIGIGDELQAHMIAVSDQFTSSIHVDFMKLFNESLTIMENPAISIKEAEFNVLAGYHVVASDLVKLKHRSNTDAIQYLISSVFSYLGDLWSMELASGTSQKAVTKQTARSRSIFNSFIRLVTDHHNSQRNMAFYADKLCLTPKYLSKIVKEVSGKSAPDWIDTYVILEAKNMLRYSTIPIKEIVFKLNFPNQSVFYKFFKAHTGMTPSQYRNG